MKIKASAIIEVEPTKQEIGIWLTKTAMHMMGLPEDFDDAGNGFYTGKSGCVFCNGELLCCNGDITSLIDAGNFLFYGKVIKEEHL